jgi:hypothetical protein
MSCGGKQVKREQPRYEHQKRKSQIISQIQGHLLEQMTAVPDPGGKLTEGWTDFEPNGGNLMRRVGIRH